MSKKSRTKDESFLIALYMEAKKLGDTHMCLDRYFIGSLVGLQNTAVETITKLLVQCNFIKRGEGDQVFLTPHGVKLISSLLDED